jgi:cytochrome P450
MTELREYFLGLLQQKRKSPAEDVLSSLANPAPGEPGETVVPDRDIAGLFMALIVAGHEAMTGLIGNGLHGILSDARCKTGYSAIQIFRRLPSTNCSAMTGRC